MTTAHDLVLASQKYDRRVNAILVGVAVLVIGVALFALVAIPTIQQNSSSTEAVRSGTDLQACRSVAFTSVTDASTELQIAEGSLVATLVAKADPQVAVAALQAAISAAKKSTETYKAAVEKSQSDPRGFAADCAKK